MQKLARCLNMFDTEFPTVTPQSDTKHVGAAAGMRMMRRISGCGWYYGAGACCGVRCMCTAAGSVAIQVDVITRRKGVCPYARAI